MRLTFMSPAIPTSKWIACLLAASWIVGECSVRAQEIHPYQTAPSMALASSLERNWQSSNQQIPLLDLVQQWKITHSIPVWLDRRIPSDAEIAMRETWTTAGDSITGTAEQLEADAAYVDGVVMIVPRGMAAHLETAYWSLATNKIAKPWLRLEETVLSWDDGAEATDILDAFCSRFPLIDFQTDQLEHDLWRSASLNQTTPLVVAIGLLSAFDLQPVVTDSRIAVQPIARESIPEILEWQYRNEIPKLGKERWQKWRARWSDAEVRRVGSDPKSSWLISAPVAAHRELVWPLAPPPKDPTPADSSRIRYSGRYRGELQTILRSLAKQKELQLEIPDLSPAVLRQELDLVFDQATFEEILKRISSASGLQLRLDGNSLRVSLP